MFKKRLQIRERERNEEMVRTKAVSSEHFALLIHCLVQCRCAVQLQSCNAIMLMIARLVDTKAMHRSLLWLNELLCPVDRLLLQSEMGSTSTALFYARPAKRCVQRREGTTSVLHFSFLVTASM